ncbi:MAG: hypothetical protein PHS32_20930 [Rhodoferax sp.]|nr:hypothetical protein [Rhodoferax sp.]MDD5336208.1 hypothetical protein [Rhodoferax sp.]
MFDTLAILPALIAVGLLAAAILPRPDVSGEAWTAAAFSRAVKQELGIDI